MSWVSKERIEKAREIGLLEYLQTCEPQELAPCGNGREYRTANHGSLVLWHGYWYWNRGCIGGETALDYLVNVRQMDFVDAVTLLSDARLHPSYTRHPPKPQAQAPPPKKLLLPPRHKDHYRVIAYLMGRGISRAVIDLCIDQGILYENAKYHNAVFVGRDEEGKARFAALRGIKGNFKQDVAGSNKRHGFCVPPINAGASCVAVFEAPVDALSHATLCTELDCHRLSLGGTTSLALMDFLETHPGIQQVVLCLDNDDAGRAAAEKITAWLQSDERYNGLDVKQDLPPPGLDYNEKLLQRTQREHNGRREAAVSFY